MFHWWLIVLASQWLMVLASQWLMILASLFPPSLRKESTNQLFIMY